MFWSTSVLSVRIYVEVVRYVNLSCWRKILWSTLRSDSLFALTRLYVEIVPYIKKFPQTLRNLFPFGARSDCTWAWYSKEIPFGYSSLLSLVPRNYFRWDICWNFHAGASELILFGARLDRFWDSRSPEIPSLGFLLVFTRWGLP